MVEVAAIDVTGSAVLLGVRAAFGIRNDGHRDGTGQPRELDRLRSEATGTAPDQHHVAVGHRVPGPAVQHPIRGGPDQGRRGGFLPGEVRGLREHLVRLDPGELPERAVVGVVAVDAGRRRDHRVLAPRDPGIVGQPPTGMGDHVIADLDAGHVRADGVDDAGCVRSTDVEVLGLAALLSYGDLVDRVAARGPDVVVVDARCHDSDEHFVRTECRGGDDLGREGRRGIAVAVPAHSLHVHRLGHRPIGGSSPIGTGSTPEVATAVRSASPLIPGSPSVDSTV